MQDNSLLSIIKSDLHRYSAGKGYFPSKFLRYYLFNSGFKFTFWLRLAANSNGFFKTIAIIQHRRFSKKYFLDIHYKTTIGKGFYLGHGQCVVINPSAVIGSNVNIGHFTTIGSNKGKAAVIGNCVYIGPNVNLVEDIVITNNVVIGAGTVITKDLREEGTYAGVPGKKISSNTSTDFIQNPCD